MSKSYLIDMDGVIMRGNQLVPGADGFIERLHQRGIKFLILTNNPLYTPMGLQQRLNRVGITLTPDHFYTSAQATAAFLQRQRPNGTAFVVGESGLTEALREVGYVLTTHDPDYVVLGETTAISYEQITRATRLILDGARFVATNPDPNGPTEGGIVPACGAVAAMLQAATGVTPYFVGKPNPIILRTALRAIGEHSDNAIMVGDRMDTDIRVGTEAGMETVLVLSGVTTLDMVPRFPYQPTRIVESVASLEAD